MSITLEFFTATRDDVVNMAQFLALNLRKQALINPAKPILWSNYGSLGSGKSLLAEEIAQNLEVGFAQNPFSQKPYSGYSFQYPFTQIQFHDIQFPHLSALWYRPFQRHFQKRKIEDALSAQDYGGILFIHNARKAMEAFQPDVEVSIMGKRLIKDMFNNHASAMPAFSLSGLERKGLLNDYEALRERVCHPDDLRLIEIKIHNFDIFKAGFINQFKLISAFDQGRRSHQTAITPDPLAIPVPFMV